MQLRAAAAAGISYDNDLAATFDGLYKVEVIRRRGPWLLEAVEFTTLDWADRFNAQRLLRPIGDMLSAEAEIRYFAMPNDPAMAA